jgi:integrase
MFLLAFVSKMQYIHHVNAGITRDQIKEWCGHTDIRTTERYARVGHLDAFRRIINNQKKVKAIASNRPQTGHDK